MLMLRPQVLPSFFPFRLELHFFAIALTFLLLLLLFIGQCLHNTVLEVRVCRYFILFVLRGFCSK